MKYTLKIELISVWPSDYNVEMPLLSIYSLFKEIEGELVRASSVISNFRLYFFSNSIRPTTIWPFLISCSIMFTHTWEMVVVQFWIKTSMLSMAVAQSNASWCNEFWIKMKTFSTINMHMCDVKRSVGGWWAVQVVLRKFLECSPKAQRPCMEQHPHTCLS